MATRAASEVGHMPLQDGYAALNHRFMWTSDDADRTFTHRFGLIVDIHQRPDRSFGASMRSIPPAMDRSLGERMMAGALLIARDRARIRRQWERCHRACDAYERLGEYDGCVSDSRST
jgi:hypothetical protein